MLSKNPRQLLVIYANHSVYSHNLLILYAMTFQNNEKRKPEGLLSPPQEPHRNDPEFCSEHLLKMPQPRRRHRHIPY